MRKMVIVICIIGSLFFIPTDINAIEVAPRITDREIIEALAELKAGQKAIQQQITDLKDSTNKQIADTNKRIDELKEGQKALEGRMDRLEGRIDTLIYAVLGSFVALLGSFVALMGFIIWDRRTAISPAIRKNKELEEREDKVERALKEYANKEPRLAEILRNVGIM